MWPGSKMVFASDQPSNSPHLQSTVTKRRRGTGVPLCGAIPYFRKSKLEHTFILSLANLVEVSLRALVIGAMNIRFFKLSSPATRGWKRAVNAIRLPWERIGSHACMLANFVLRRTDAEESVGPRGFRWRQRHHCQPTTR